MVIDRKATGMAQCHHCTTVQSAENSKCNFCHAKIHGPDLSALQRSWAYLITGILLYIPANYLPIMTANEFGHVANKTIVGGAVEMWNQGAFLVAGIIFMASIVIPIAKFIALTILCLSQQFNFYTNPLRKIKLYRVTEIIGRWSMIDVFVVAFLASLIQLGNIMSIYPGPAVLAFAGMVVCTMLSAASLDSTLFWGSDV